MRSGEGAGAGMEELVFPVLAGLPEDFLVGVAGVVFLVAIGTLISVYAVIDSCHLLIQLACPIRKG